MTEIIENIELDRIIPDPNNRRIGGHDSKKLEQLADSIRTVGVQQPIVVRQIDGQYRLVAGERRWLAAKIAECEAIPAVVRELSDLQVLKIQTIENLQREDIHPLDEAEGYHRLLDQAHYDAAALAKEVGKSVSYIYQRLKLRELVPEAREALVQGGISAGHAILIARLQPGAQQQALEVALGSGKPPSVQELDYYIQGEILHDLGRAAFKKDDSDLVPAAGACTACAKRTGYIPDLFPEIQKADKCMDGDCYEAKLDAQVERQRAALKEKKAVSFEAIGHRSYGGYDPEKTKGAAKTWEWDECKKSDPEAKRVLIVAGPGKGRLTYGKKRKSSSYSRAEMSPEEKERASEKRRKEKIKAETRLRLWQAVMQKAQERDLEDGRMAMPLEMLRLCVRQIAERLWFDHQKKIARLEGWDIEPRDLPEKTSELDYLELNMLLYKIALIYYAEEARLYSYSERSKDPLKDEATRLGIDIKAIETAVKEEMKPRKKAGKKKPAEE